MKHEHTGAGEMSATLDGSVASRVKALEFRAERAVRSLRAGMHRSRDQGSSTVFSEHRPYRPGDDLRRLDWRAYARSGKPVVRRFEQEAQLRATLVLDDSASMNWPTPDTADHKGDAAVTLLAAAALLLLEQGDAVRLLRLSDREPAPYSSGRSALPAILRRLSEPFQAMGEAPAMPLGAQLQRTSDGSALIVASDFLDVLDAPIPWRTLVTRAPRVVAFQVLHKGELEPDAREARFVACEDDAFIEADFERVREGYTSALQAFCNTLRSDAQLAGASLRLARSDEDPVLVLASAFGSGVAMRTERH
ncbi:MAG: DUF58 domain-containing protein [Myxococcota bacterium]